VVGLTLGSQIPLETGFSVGRDDDDATVLPTGDNSSPFVGGRERAVAASMPRPTADKALTRLGARINALRKGAGGS
jgi:cyanophycinase-like exopeptidase